MVTSSCAARICGDGRLSIAENKLPPTLFGSYDAARNAVRRTRREFKKLPLSPVVKVSDFKIVRVEQSEVAS